VDGNGGAIAVRGKAPRGLCEQYDPANPAAVAAASGGQQCLARRCILQRVDICAESAWFQRSKL